MILPKNYLVLDVETANKNRNSVCQIGITYIANETVKSIKTININPECYFDKMNTNIHGITSEAVKTSKTFSQVFPLLKKILEQCPVYHQSPFDPGAIKNTCERYDLENINANWKNSIDIFQNYWPYESSYKLSTLCKKNHIKFQHHNAGEDTFATAQLLNLAANNRRLNIPHEFIPKIVSGPFSGKTIIFSGDMNKLELENKAKAVGFEIVKGITQKTDYLCLGKLDQRTIDSGNTKSGKHKKAEELRAKGHHITVINEEDFLNLISK